MKILIDAFMILLLLFCTYTMLFYVGSLVVQVIPVTIGKKIARKDNWILCVIPAHNEESCLENIISDLKKQTYEHMNIMVILDNCTDTSEAICIKTGVWYYKRQNLKYRGKQHALSEFFRTKRNQYHDAVMVFDADNRVGESYVQIMNDELNRGNRLVVQSYVEVSNKNHSWVSRSYEINWRFINSMGQRFRGLMGLPCYLSGRGYIIKREALDRITFNCDTITEDLEYTVKLMLNGIRVHWTDRESVYDEQPIGFKESYKQRLRWFRGQYQVLKKYGFKVLKAILIKKGKRFKYVDMLIVMLNPYVNILAFGNLIYCACNWSTLKAFFIWQVMYYVIFIVFDRKSSLKLLFYIIQTMLFNITNMFIYIHAFITKNKYIWNRTQHYGS